MKQNTKMTKAKLDEIYSRPETHDFERLNALMEWARGQLSTSALLKLETPNKFAESRPANKAIPKAAKTLLSILLVVTLAFGFSGCTKEVDKCANKTCFNGGTCHDGTCTCEQWYEGANCSDAMRDKFVGNFTGTMSDGTGWQMSEDVTIGTGTAINAVRIELFGAIIITGNLTGSHNVDIPAQTVQYGSETCTVGGSGICFGNNVILDFILVTPTDAANYHFDGNK